MMQKLALLSGLMLSVNCMVIHQAPVPVNHGQQYHDSPYYNFAYEVNDGHTGDIKNQQESRRGDLVLGQYSLVQPDGIRRVVDYRADEHAGFLATVNNERQNYAQNGVNHGNNNVEASRQAAPINSAYFWPSATQTQTSAPAPAVAISRTSIVQTFSPSHNTVAQNNPSAWASSAYNPAGQSNSNSWATPAQNSLAHNNPNPWL